MCIISFNPYSHFIDIILFLKDFIYLFSERREGREKERERNTDQIGCLLFALPIWGRTRNLGLCPNQESNQQPFALQDDAQLTEPHWSGLIERIYS